MPHPKRKFSKSRSAKRRTHYKTNVPDVAICQVTGTPHLFHRAYWVENKLYYKGKVVMEK